MSKELKDNGFEVITGGEEEQAKDIRAKNKKEKAPFEFEIIASLGVLAFNGTMRKELNFISWNGGEPKYDIRNWHKDNKMGKGLTLTKEELKGLKDLLNSINLEEEES